MKQLNTEFCVKSDALADMYKSEAEVLLSNRDAILEALATNGMHKDPETPHAYYIPSGLAFNSGKGKWQMRSLYAIVVMARASHSIACWLDTDKDGLPELPQFCGGTEGFHRVYITNPFAYCIDEAIKRHQRNTK